MTLPLTFADLRYINTKRCIEHFKHPLNAWSVAEWGNATAGECGEACNVAKKMLRIRQNMHIKDNPTETELKQMLADEIADTVIYCDLWAASENINLAVATVKKFNEDSIKRKSSFLIG